LGLELVFPYSMTNFTQYHAYTFFVHDSERNADDRQALRLGKIWGRCIP